MPARPLVPVFTRAVAVALASATAIPLVAAPAGAAPATGPAHASASAAPSRDALAGLWRTPRYGVEAPAQMESGLRRTPRYGVDAPAQVEAGLRRTPRYGVEAPAQVEAGLRRTPRYGVEAPAQVEAGLRRTPRYGVDAPAQVEAGLRRTPRYGVQTPRLPELPTGLPAGPLAPPALSALTQIMQRLSMVASPARAGVTAKAAAPASSTAVRLLGRKRSATPWYSGAWTGGYMSGARAEAFGRWRGTALDSVTTYPDKSTWASLRDSRWHITTYATAKGRLVYGLPLLPERGPGTLADVAKGRYDAVFAQIATDLRSTGRGTSIVRIGFEANGTWHRYGGTAKNAATWKAAYRRVAKVMTARAPGLVLDFDITCGFSMPGAKHQLDSLTKLYPGDDVVDLVGCDMYDEWQTAARTPAQWRRAIRPAATVGIADVAAFARAHRKGMSIPEWGVAGRSRGGNGDNPFFVQAMRGWMRANADVLVLENYFNDRGPHVRSDLWGGQNPRSAAAYRKAW